jgi:hypothetical protein
MNSIAAIASFDRRKWTIGKAAGGTGSPVASAPPRFGHRK